MRKIFPVLMLALLASGCVRSYRTNDGERRYHFFGQRGIMLQVTHYCTGYARVYQSGEGLVAEIIGAEPQQIPLDPETGEREILLTLQSLDSDGNVVWSVDEDFRIDRNSTTSQIWTLSRDGSRCRSRQLSLLEYVTEQAGRLAE